MDNITATSTHHPVLPRLICNYSVKKRQGLLFRKQQLASWDSYESQVLALDGGNLFIPANSNPAAGNLLPLLCDIVLWVNYWERLCIVGDLLKMPGWPAGLI